MHITRAADYGVRIMTRLAAAPEGTRMTVADLAGDSNASAWDAATPGGRGSVQPPSTRAAPPPHRSTGCPVIAG